MRSQQTWLSGEHKYTCGLIEQILEDLAEGITDWLKQHAAHRGSRRCSALPVTAAC